MPDPVTTVVGETNPHAAGNTTSEYFWTKVLIICGIVTTSVGFLGDVVSQVSGLLPAGSPALRYAGIAGAVVTVVTKIAYTASRTLVKMKLVDAETAAKDVPDPAATVLGGDAPQK